MIYARALLQCTPSFWVLHVWVQTLSSIIGAVGVAHVTVHPTNWHRRVHGRAFDGEAPDTCESLIL